MEGYLWLAWLIFECSRCESLDCRADTIVLRCYGRGATNVALSRSNALTAPPRQLSAKVADMGSGKMSSSPFSTPWKMARATDCGVALGISKPRVISVSVGPVSTAWTLTPCPARRATHRLRSMLNAAAFEIA